MSSSQFHNSRIYPSLNLFVTIFLSSVEERELRGTLREQHALSRDGPLRVPPAVDDILANRREDDTSRTATPTALPLCSLLDATPPQGSRIEEHVHRLVSAVTSFHHGRRIESATEEATTHFRPRSPKPEQVRSKGRLLPKCDAWEYRLTCTLYKLETSPWQ